VAGAAARFGDVANEGKSVERGLRVDVDQTARVIAVAGELDMATVDIMMRAALPLAAEPGNLTIDLSSTSFMDSSGLNGLLSLARAVRRYGRLIVRGARPNVRRVFEMSGIEGSEPLLVLSPPDPELDKSR
jgi:anti-anti-sigma factor